MALRPCLTCGQLTRTGSYCPAHTPAQGSRAWRAGSTRQWRGLRAQALLRDGHRCRNCGTVDGLHVHHLVELHHGGRDTLENLVTLCDTCHHGAHGPAAA